MEQQSLLDLPPPQPPEDLTAWASGAPPVIGWWATRTKRDPEHWQPQRRWWDGERWSVPVFPTDADDVARVSMWLPSLSPVDGIEWRGLTAAHPDGYTDEQWQALDALHACSGEVGS